MDINKIIEYLPSDKTIGLLTENIIYKGEFLPKNSIVYIDNKNQCLYFSTSFPRNYQGTNCILDYLKYSSHDKKWETMNCILSNKEYSMHISESLFEGWKAFKEKYPDLAFPSNKDKIKITLKAESYTNKDKYGTRGQGVHVKNRTMAIKHTKAKKCLGESNREKICLDAIVNPKFKVNKGIAYNEIGMPIKTFERIERVERVGIKGNTVLPKLTNYSSKEEPTYKDYKVQEEKVHEIQQKESFYKKFTEKLCDYINCRIGDSEKVRVSSNNLIYYKQIEYDSKKIWKEIEATSLLVYGLDEETINNNGMKFTTADGKWFLSKIINVK